MKKTKVAIHVEGGIIQSVFSDTESLAIEVFDLDEPDLLTESEFEEFKTLQNDFEKIRKKLMAVY